tara:strand:- start:5395 stop:5568 length:174 start_codon:yes stop_codon:yes gene_type:complete
MKETIDSISDEMLEYIKQLFEEKMLEYGVEEVREEWTRSEVTAQLIMKLEDDYIIES